MNKTAIEWCAAEWRPIPSFPGYYVSEDGRILSCKADTPRVLRAITHRPDNHLYVFLYRSGQMVKVWVHRAVLSAWDREAAAGEECRHLDGNPANNHRANLAWGSRQENSADKRLHGTQPRGERVGTHKLSAADVIAIRQRHGKESLRSLAREYGVSHTAIRRAALGIKWAHLEGGRAS